jgi:two-component system chemotaxis response regulator CheY
MKILVVDDSRMMRRLIRSTLEGGGYAPEDILEAADGIPALEMLQQMEFKVDLVLADWNMPQMDGISLLKSLRTLAPADEVPVIMCTSQAQLGQVRGALYAGAREYVVKPFTSELLLQKVAKVLQGRMSSKAGDTTIILKAISSAGQSPAAQSVLSQLPPAAMDKICKAATVAEHPAGAVFIKPGDRVESLHVIAQGVVEVIDPDITQATEARLTGDCVGELAFLSGQPAGFTARARTPVRLASLEKARFSDLLMEYPELTYFMARIRARYAARRNRKVTSDLEEGLSGSLKVVPLPELVQTLKSTAKTGLLRLTRGPETAELAFDGGELRHASVGTSVGEEAFYRLMVWEEGKFTFDPKVSTEKTTIHRPTMTILLDGMRRLDESRRDSPPPPD